MTDEVDGPDIDCREALHRVYHFLDGELTPDRRDKIAHHLDRCSPCLQVFGFETEIRKLVANRCRDQVPDELRIRIASAIDHEHRESSKASSKAEGEES